MLDVEEEENGLIYSNSTDLELIDDGGEQQIIGLHFKNIQLPQGAAIEQAYLQFQTDEVSNGACELNIYGEAVDDATSFSTTLFDVSNRTSTNGLVNWSPDNWSVVGAAGLTQQTPNIEIIIQEIINQSQPAGT